MMNAPESKGIVLAQESCGIEPGSIPLPRFSNERYAVLRAAGLQPIEAARQVGLDPRNGAATKLERRRAVQQRMAWLRRHEPDVAAERKRYVEERLTLWHDVDIGDFYEDVEEPVINPVTGGPVILADGTPLTRWTQRLKPFSELGRELRMCIESLKYTEKGKPNLQLYSKLDANRDYRKLHGLDMPTKIAPTNPAGDGNAVVTQHLQWLDPVDPPG